MGKHKGGKGGTIVNIASLAGLTSCFPLCPVYSSSKYAVVGFGVNVEVIYVYFVQYIHLHMLTILIVFSFYSFKR